MLFSNADQALIKALDRSMAVIQFTPQGEILTANENFLKTLGYSLNEIKGKHHRMFCDQVFVNSPAYTQFWQDLGRGQYRSDTFKRICKDGKPIWIEATYNPVFAANGTVAKVVKFARDVTASAIHAHESNAKLEAIERSMAVIEFTPKGDVVRANDNFLNALGYTASEISGQHHRLFCETDYVRSADYGAFWQGLAKGEFKSGEFHRIGKGGRDIYIQATYNPIFDDTGAVVKVVKFATDITAVVQKRKENESTGRSAFSQMNEMQELMGRANQLADVTASSSTETSSIINSVAAASEELAQSVKEIAHSMSNARSGVENVFSSAGHANQSAETLRTSAEEMNSIVTLIQNIAGQINLLALNATIESARAGEAGRGFAVVASEVKSLANQAASATQTISNEINKIQSITGTVVDALSSITQNMNGVLENVTGVASAIEQQTAVTQEITLNMQGAVGAIHQIDDSISQLNASFDGVSVATHALRGNVEKLAS